MTITVGQLIEEVSARFERAELAFGHGTDNPWDEAVALVLGVSGQPDDQSALNAIVSDADCAQIQQVAQARESSRQPLTYLLGWCHYAGYQFAVEPGVMVPRSPIGLLLADRLDAYLSKPPQRVLDLCSGTGCLGIMAAHRFPQARITLIKMDSQACEVAMRNVHAHGLSERCEIVQADATRVQLSAPADLVLCNPPYVNAADMQDLPGEFRAEPRAGLAAGPDGLDVMAPVLDHLARYLAPGGLFVGEVGASQPALELRYAHLPLIWLELPMGGEGIFLLEADQVSSHTAQRINPSA